MKRSESMTEIHSDEVSRILSLKPKWLIRNGMILIFISFMLLVILALGVKVPVIIKVPVNVSMYRDSSIVQFYVNRSRGATIKAANSLTLHMVSSDLCVNGSVSQIRFSDSRNLYFIKMIGRTMTKNKGAVPAITNDTAEIQIGYEPLLLRFFIKENAN